MPDAGRPPAQDRHIPDPAVEDEKRRLRTWLLARRRARPAAERAAARAAIADHLRTELASASTICGYLPLASEPLPAALLDDLVRAGATVLLPVVAGARPLDWVRHRPGEDPPPALVRADDIRVTLGAAAVVEADVLLVPALAVDRRGYRLGRGGGHYDRTLALAAHLAAGAARVIGVVYDDELLDHVPVDALDLPVGWVVTPGTGLRTGVMNT